MEDYYNSIEMQLGISNIRGLFREKYGNIPLRDAVLRYIDEIESIETTYALNRRMLDPPNYDLYSMRMAVEDNTLTDKQLEMFVEESIILKLFKVYFDQHNRYGQEFAQELEEQLDEQNKGEPIK